MRAATVLARGRIGIRPASSSLWFQNELPVNNLSAWTCLARRADYVAFGLRVFVAAVVGSRRRKLNAHVLHARMSFWARDARPV